MDSVSPVNRPLSAPRRASAAIFAALRHALGRVFQVFFRDQLRDLNRQTERLGSASVESATYLGRELQALDQRLSRIEHEVASLREAVVSGRPPR
jgi:hypothetical protein